MPTPRRPAQLQGPAVPRALSAVHLPPLPPSSAAASPLGRVDVLLLPPRRGLTRVRLQQTGAPRGRGAPARSYGHRAQVGGPAPPAPGRAGHQGRSRHPEVPPAPLPHQVPFCPGDTLVNKGQATATLRVTVTGRRRWWPEREESSKLNSQRNGRSGKGQCLGAPRGAGTPAAEEIRGIPGDGGSGRIPARRSDRPTAREPDCSSVRRSARGLGLRSLIVRVPARPPGPQSTRRCPWRLPYCQVSGCDLPAGAPLSAPSRRTSSGLLL